MAKPISLAEARKRDSQTPPPDDTEPVGCPITPLGHADGKFWFLNFVGEKRALSARQLGARAEIAALFLGDMTWLQREFKSLDQNGAPNGFKVSKACEYLMNECRRAGIYGDHVIIRRPGVWPGEDDTPIAHCGDALFIGGEKHESGVKIAGQIFAATSPEPHPAREVAPALTGRRLQADMRALWSFRDEGADVIAVGLIGQAYLAAALSWRANGFISGDSNSGKSYLLNLMRAVVPLHHFSTDTTKAGIEGAVNGRAVPSFIDESSDRSDGQGGNVLLDVVLSASSGAGTKGHRGTADGGVRAIEMVGSVIMASIAPPAMQPQHRSRFVMIELNKPAQGADNLAPMQAAIARGREDGPALFARALRGFARYRAALDAFREALKAVGCVPREMDNLGAILAGHWLLTEDGVPDEEAAAETVKIIADGFVRGADDMAREDTPQAVLAMLLSRVVSLDRSTDQESIARLIEQAMNPSDDVFADRRGHAVKVLERWGIRPLRADQVYVDDNEKKGPLPRLGMGNGLWIDPRVQPLRGIFTGTPYDGDRWLIALMRLPSAHRAKKAVRVGALPTPCKAIWISWDEISEVHDTG